jgi:hypothetical protein
MPLLHSEQFAAEYGRFGFSDHWPMERFARASMGASEADLAARHAATIARLDPLPPRLGQIDVATQFNAHLGQRQAYPNYLELFRERIASDGVASTLDTYWPILEPGLCAAAFHGLIRLAYGLEASDESEIAAGLAYTASAHADLDLDAAHPAPSRHAAVTAMQSWTGQPATECFSRQPSISARLQAATADEPIRKSFLRAGLPTGFGLAEVRRFALDLYGATGDFAALHGLTGTHAARIISQHTAVSQYLPARLWSTILAIHLIIGAPDLTAQAPSKAEDWPDLFKTALSSEDAHDVKLVYSAHAEWQHTGEDGYRRIANLRLHGSDATG